MTGEPMLFGEPLADALVNGLLSGTIQIESVRSEMSRGDHPRLEVAFAVTGTPTMDHRTMERSTIPGMKPISNDLKPGDICPVCVGLGVTCQPCEGEGVVIDRRHYDPYPTDGGWRNEWAGHGDPDRKVKPPAPRKTQTTKRTLPASPNIVTLVVPHPASFRHDIRVSMEMDDGNTIGTTYSVDEMMLSAANGASRDAMLRTMAERLSLGVAQEYAKAKLTPAVAKVLYDELG